MRKWFYWNVSLQYYLNHLRCQFKKNFTWRHNTLDQSRSVHLVKNLVLFLIPALLIFGFLHRNAPYRTLPVVSMHDSELHENQLSKNNVWILATIATTIFQTVHLMWYPEGFEDHISSLFPIYHAKTILNSQFKTENFMCRPSTMAVSK